LENRGFKGVVEEAWRGFRCNGWMSFVLKEKLKMLKFRLKEWHIVEYGDMEANIDKLVGDIHDLDVRGEEGGLNEEEVHRCKSLFVDLWKILKAKDANMVQRARS
jgi:hypothetical protein